VTRDASADSPDRLARAKRRLIREADSIDRHGRRRLRRASMGVHVGSALAGVLLGHRGTRRSALAALDALARVARFLEGDRRAPRGRR